MSSPLRPRRHGVAAFLLGLVFLCVPAYSHAAETGVSTDLTWGIPSSDVAPTEAAIRDIGARWVRLEFRWDEGETRNDSYNQSTLSKWDQAVATSEAAGAKIIAMVHQSPSWASGSTDTHMPPQNSGDLADFMTFLANRYRGRVAAWEIWNEPNSKRFWPSGPNPAGYVELLKAGHDAVKAADPNTLVVFGGLTQNDYGFVEGAYAAGAKGYFDVMNVHPYPGPHPPEHVWYDGDRISQWAFTGYREVRKSMLANGDDKPIWLTEFGWSTTTTDSWGVTPEQQADYLKRAYCVLAQDPYVGVALWYNLRNNHWNNDADTWETQLGLMKTTFERKSSYNAFKSYAEGTQGCGNGSPLREPESNPLLPDVPSVPPDEMSGGLPDTPVTGVTAPVTAGLRLRSPMLAVNRALIRQGRLIVDGRVARRAKGTIRGVTSYEGVKHELTARIDSAGKLKVREWLPGGEDALSGWVALVFPRNSAFHGQWVILQAAARSAQLKLAPDAQATSSGQTRWVQGTVASDARGWVVLTLGYRTAGGAGRLVTRRCRIRGGEFRRSLKLPAGAEDAVLYAVFPGDAARGISGSSRTLRLH